MGRWARVCLQSTLKVVNSILGFAGMGMILYSLWLIRVWYRHGVPDSASPWFMYAFLGLGISLCLITCSGYIAAETANGHCLSCYMVVVFLLLALEAAITADVFLNRNWEEDFPDDPSGKFDEFKDFVRSNFEMCKWISLSIAATQALSIFIAMVLRVLGPERMINYDSDDDYVPTRLPLLRNQAPRTSYVTDPVLPQKNESWNVNFESS
ncbi:uncharacterized protein A4U43_C07F20940 [Asparagus officinalis]|uniref:Tetraspanin-19-like n=1 Tax=Asparagus officinalis TaxID=4686 RepID=A0A5P1EDL9_ASPOF|nr:tetraspanin-19-like [Asparagus officinalis]ONK63986.1 uncharacterized protein A4U43_C07F20940 [Asparagus officinalis]